MTKGKVVWGWLAFLVALDLIVPWYMLTNDGRFLAAFLFWTIWTAVAIASMFVVMRRWKE